MCVEFAKMRHRLLNDATANTNAAHQPPIAVNLPVLPYRRVAQIHATTESDSPQSENTLSWHYTPKSPLEVN
jgi:hypothetical protein